MTTADLQWLRKATLVLSAGTKESGGAGIDLSSLRIKFEVQSAGFETPDNAWIRIYNAKPETVALARKEFDRVTLQCGYRDGAMGVIFDGTVRLYGEGREDATDTYFDVFAADETLYNYGRLNGTVPAGSSIDELLNRVAQGMGGTLQASNLPATGGILPRSRVLWGLGRNVMRSLSRTLDAQWYIQGDKVIIRPTVDPLDAPPIDVNMENGLIGQPEQTTQGIRCRTLLNPRFRIGSRIRLNSKLVAQKQFTSSDQGHVAYNQRAGTPQYLATVGKGDGEYAIYVLDHEGDTRATPWYSNLVLLAIDSSTGKILAQ